MDHTCTFCRATGAVHEVEAPAIRLCGQCREKLNTHIAVVCSGCATLHWLPKNPQNVMRAAEMSGLSPEHILSNAMVQEIKSCKRCYDGVQDFVKKARWGLS